MSVLAPFHPAVRAWFEGQFGSPTEAQAQGWPAIQQDRHVLLAAPTGSGKTLAAFLWALDGLFRGAGDVDGTRVLYVSPLRALSNDVEKNLRGPLAGIRALDPTLPEVRVRVRTGDTPARDRAAVQRRPPHVLVTTPESLYLMLTSEGGRKVLATVRSVIVDEIHALVRDKRGSHLALSLERLEALTARPPQRIGLSATQKPLSAVGRFLVGAGRECHLVDAGSFRQIDLAVEIPPSALSTVCSHEQWDEIHQRIAALVQEHRTTLVFVNTRSMAERMAAQLTRLLGEEAVTSHHGSLSRERRLDAESRLKAGRLRALVATASLELGIDIGDVDLVVQIGASRAVATLLQRVGRAGHGRHRVPRGRMFPLTLDELVEAAALLRCLRGGILDRTPEAPPALDVLAQQVVAACVPEPWDEERLLAVLRRAWPYRDLTPGDFEAVLALHADGRRALLHRDGVARRLRATRRARLTALLSGGAIPDTADYEVRQEPEGTLVGTVNEDWAIESSRGDVFQLGNTSWRILKVETGVMRVADAKGQPPSVPFWLGEGPGRTRELSAEVSATRERAASAASLEEAVAALQAFCGPGLPHGAALQVAEFVRAGCEALGAVPTPQAVVAERFFDESGGMQLVIHAPFGARINRAWGLALRKRFCVGFGFELQAAANEEAIVLSLGLQHSFPLLEVFDFLAPATARDVLVQALLAAPMFEARWRWNLQRSLLLERRRNGRRIPAALLRMRADDMLASAFPEVQACPETLPGGPIEVPMEHPIVRQSVEDCLTEAMDVDGFLEIVRGLRDGSIRRHAVDTAEPSAFARGILNSAPYTFLDDAPLEERRTRAVLSRRTLDPKTADRFGELDAEAIERVREEAWPQPANAEEVHEALLWMGCLKPEEARAWAPWLEELSRAGRVVREEEGWFAVEASRDPLRVLRGRLEALGPIFAAAGEEPLLRQLESEGHVLRTRLRGREAWCDRRLLARIQRYTVERLRREIEPVSAAVFLRALARWQHVAPGHQLEGPLGAVEAAWQLAGFEAPAAAWEAKLLPARVRGYRREWLDQATLSGELAWLPLWTFSAAALRRVPVALVPRADLPAWLTLRAPEVGQEDVIGSTAALLAALRARGACFFQELGRLPGVEPAALESDLGELVRRGLATCDSFGGLRFLLVPRWRRGASLPAGRWTALPARDAAPAAEPEFVARQLLRRYGVIFRRVLTREKQPVPWRDLARACRTLEARGELRGGRFVAGFDGEQYALPEVVTLLREVRREGGAPVAVSAADPLNLQGILTPDERISPLAREEVKVG